MNFNNSDSYSFSESSISQTFMQRVYQWMAIGLSLTGFIAFFAARHMGVMKFMMGGGIWLFFLIELGIVIWLSRSITKISANAAKMGFLIYSAINGLVMASIFLIYTQTSIASTFFITAGTFAAVSFYGWTTKQDLTSIGSFLFMGLIGIIIASIVNIFLRSPIFYWIISYAGVAIFIGLTAYDTQQLKRIQQSGQVAPDQLAVFGALKLYLDFINLFLFLLRIFGRRR